MTREPGQGRRDLRKHTKPGALQRSHRKGCGKPAAAALLIVLAVPSVTVWSGYQLAAAVFGGGS